MISIIVQIIVIIMVFQGVKYYRKKRQQELIMAEEAIAEEKNLATSKILEAFSSGRINERQKDELLNQINRYFHWGIDIDEKINEYDNYNQWETYYIDKYGKEIAYRLLNHEYWVGMTEEQLIECKGKPDKIEKEVLKTKEKLTYIYGNKSSGDYFVIENGLVVKFTDR